MGKARNAVEVTVGGTLTRDSDGKVTGREGGRRVVITELNTGEVATAMERASATKSDAARNFKTALHGLRLSIKAIDDKPVTPMDLEGSKLDDVFSVRELTLLGRAWNDMHLPDDDEVAATVQGTKAISS